MISKQMIYMAHFKASTKKIVLDLHFPFRARAHTDHSRTQCGAYKCPECKFHKQKLHKK